MKFLNSYAVQSPRVKVWVFGDEEHQLAGLGADLNFGCLAQGIHAPSMFKKELRNNKQS
jgi:hypothetical protein